MHADTTVFNDFWSSYHVNAIKAPAGSLIIKRFVASTHMHCVVNPSLNHGSGHHTLGSQTGKDRAYSLSILWLCCLCGRLSRGTKCRRLPRVLLLLLLLLLLFVWLLLVTLYYSVLLHIVIIIVVIMTISNIVHYYCYDHNYCVLVV